MEKSASIWREMFLKWPPHFKRKGVIEPVRGESIPFIDFVMSEDVVVIERATPDTTGARRVAVPFQNIMLLKFTEPLNTEAFLLAGYVLGANAGTVKANPAQPAVAARR